MAHSADRSAPLFRYSKRLTGLRHWVVRLAGAMGLALAAVIVQPGVASAATVHITGHVTDRTGAPVANVTVLAGDPSDYTNSLFYTNTLDDGSYDLAVDTDVTAPATYDLRFSPACCGRYETDIKGYVVLGDSVVDAKVGPFTYKGTLKDIDGLAIPHARLTLVKPDGSAILDNLPGGVSPVGFTSDSGDYSMVLPSGNYHLQVSGSRTIFTSTPKTPEDYTIELALNLTDNETHNMVLQTKGITISARDQYGRTPPVGLDWSANGDGNSSNLYPGANVVSEHSSSERYRSNDSVGVATLTVLSGLTYDARLATNGRYGYDWPHQTFVATSDITTQMVMTLNALEGRLTDSRGLPILGASVGVYRLDGSVEQTSFGSGTDANGHFIVSAEPGEYLFTVAGRSDPNNRVYGYVPRYFSVSFRRELTSPAYQDMALRTVDIGMNIVDEQGIPAGPPTNAFGHITGEATTGQNLFAGADITAISFDDSPLYHGNSPLIALPGVPLQAYGESSTGYMPTTWTDPVPFLTDGSVTVIVKDIVASPVIGADAEASSSSPQLSWSAATSPYFAGAPYAYAIYRDGKQIQVVQASPDGVMTFTDSTVPVGRYTYFVKGINTWAVQSYPSNSVTISYDKTAPSVGHPSIAPAPATATLPATISASVTDDISGVTYAEYFIGNDPGQGIGTPMAFANGQATATFTPASTGTYTVGVRAKDAAGNWSPTQTSTFTVQAGVPNVPTGLTAQTPTKLKPLLQWNAANNADHYEVYRGSQNVGTTAGTSYADQALSADGTYSYTIVAVGVSGLKSAPSSAVSVSYDTVAPTVTGVPSSTGWFTADQSIVWTATDPTPSGGAPTQPAATPATQEGTHVYTSGPSCDPAGNCSTGSMTLKLDKTLPSLSGLSFGSVTNAKAVSVATATLTAQVADAVSGLDRVEYLNPVTGVWSSMPVSGGTASATVSTPAAQFPAGMYTFTVRVFDVAGNGPVIATIILDVYDPNGGYLAGHTSSTPSTGDILPDVAPGSAPTLETLDVSVQYDTSVSPATLGGKATFTYGSQCNTPKGSLGCFSVTFDSFDWLVVSATAPTATLQGRATLNLKGANQGSNYPVRLTAQDGAPDHFSLQVFPVGSNPEVAQPLYQASGNVTGGNMVFHK
jgi:hypothetical protein